jgi:hypothetical protein
MNSIDGRCGRLQCALILGGFTSGLTALVAHTLRLSFAYKIGFGVGAMGLVGIGSCLKVRSWRRPTSATDLHQAPTPPPPPVEIPRFPGCMTSTRMLDGPERRAVEVLRRLWRRGTAQVAAEIRMVEQIQASYRENVQEELVRLRAAGVPFDCFPERWPDEGRLLWGQAMELGAIYRQRGYRIMIAGTSHRSRVLTELTHARWRLANPNRPHQLQKVLRTSRSADYSTADELVQIMRTEGSNDHERRADSASLTLWWLDRTDGESASCYCLDNLSVLDNHDRQGRRIIDSIDFAAKRCLVSCQEACRALLQTQVKQPIEALMNEAAHLTTPPGILDLVCIPATDFHRLTYYSHRHGEACDDPSAAPQSGEEFNAPLRRCKHGHVLQLRGLVKLFPLNRRLRVFRFTRRTPQQEAELQHQIRPIASALREHDLRHR